MKAIEDFSKHLTGPHILEQLVDLLRTNDEDFAECEKRYLDAVQVLRRELPADVSPSLDDFLTARETDIRSILVHAGYLGYRVNLEHFHHPIGVDFVHLDTIDNLKGHLFLHMPINVRNAEIQDAFYRNLKENLREHYENITSYFIALECVGPKLAHYAGYVIANDFLPWVEPGYRPDTCQTDAFTAEIVKYLGFLPF